MSFTNQVNSQIEIVPANDLDLIIANIFGIQCDGVSNVQLLAVQDQFGRFENGSGIGLNSGLVLSTGIITGLTNPNNVFSSWSLSGYSDADISAFGAAAGQPSANFDACVVEFDFTPSISDTVRFTYVLASEEYPEYSNTQYTDRFLFLVSENAGAYVNVANLPGSLIPVEINTINQAVNPQWYVDNSVGPNSSNFVFDGFTVPLEAKFYAQIGISYHIKLVISDISDQLYDSAIFLDEQEAYNDISGALTVNGALAEGVLDVFHFISDTLLAQPVESIIVTNGNYNADSLETGLYHVRFTPDPLLFPNVAPLYYTSGTTWSTADAIGLPCFLGSGNVNGTTMPVLSGNGVINGNIVIDTSYLKSQLEPLEGALVKLYDLSNTLIAYTYSDVNGDYDFINIPSGTFHILLDVPYIPQIDEHSIVLENGQIMYGADFGVFTTGISSIDNLTLQIKENLSFDVNVFPNPVSDILNVRNNSKTDLKVEITTIDGQIVYFGSLNQGLQTIETNNFSNGIYFMKIGDVDIRKIIIKK